MAARSKAWVWGLSLAGIAGSIPAWGMDVCLLCVLDVLSGRGLCDRPISRPEYAVSERDLEISTMRPTRFVKTWKHEVFQKRKSPYKCKYRSYPVPIFQVLVNRPAIRGNVWRSVHMTMVTNSDSVRPNPTKEVNTHTRTSSYLG